MGFEGEIGRYGGISGPSTGLSQEEIDTENQMGNTCYRRTMDSNLNSLATQSLHQLNSFLLDAIRNEWSLVLIIDDYTNIHTHRRPKGSRRTAANNTCTIAVKAFKNVNAMRLPSSITSLHDQQGVDWDSCKDVICSEYQMFLMANTYASTMPDWIVTQFFQRESEQNQLYVHEYCESTSVRTMRRIDNLHLVDFVELQLKSKDNFKQAFDIILKISIKPYMQKYILLQPGDWPSQFHSRQIVNEHITNYIRQQQNMATGNDNSNNDQRPLLFHQPLPSTTTSPVPPMASVV